MLLLSSADSEATVDVVSAGGGGGGGAEVWYLTGDSFSRKSRRLGSRSRRGSLLLGGVLLPPNHPENQPICYHAVIIR